MPYNQQLANRIRESLADLPNIEEKQMMGGLTFMYNNKMCIGIIKDDMMCRIDPEAYESALEKPGCREMDFTGRPMKGWIMIDDTGMRTKADFDGWIALALAYNQKAKPKKKKK